MKTNWNFNKQFIKEVISKGYVLLDDPKLPKIAKKSIKTDISTFTRFINGNFELKDFVAKPPHDVEKLKSYILTRMQYQYKTLGEDLINWTRDLCCEGIFKLNGKNNNTDLSIDDQAELTIENYSKNSRRFLTIAKPVLSDEIIRQIQITPELKNTSYCYNDEITDLPYLIINPKQAPWILNHETQHAIEAIKKYDSHRLYGELGSIFFELLFNDVLYKNQGYLLQGDYGIRQKDTEKTLLMLYNYFQIMLNFKARNFDVPTDVFQQEFLKICNSNEENDLINFLRTEIAPPDIVDDMTYLYSYFKAIELREELLTHKQDSAYLLEPYIKTKKFNFTPNTESFSTYKRFTEEMKEKSK